MEVPQIGKVKQPFTWLIGLIAADIFVVVGTGYLILATRPSKINLDELTLPVEVQNLTLL